MSKLDAFVGPWFWVFNFGIFQMHYAPYSAPGDYWKAMSNCSFDYSLPRERLSRIVHEFSVRRFSPRRLSGCSQNFNSQSAFQERSSLSKAVQFNTQPQVEASVLFLLPVQRSWTDSWKTVPDTTSCHTMPAIPLLSQESCDTTADSKDSKDGFRFENYSAETVRLICSIRPSVCNLISYRTFEYFKPEIALIRFITPW